MIKDTFVKQGEAFAGRPTLYLMKLLYKGNYGLVFSSNEFYKAQRSFSLHALRNLGFGQSALQEAIVHEAKKAIAEMHRTNGATMQVRNCLTVGSIYIHI